MYWKLVKMSSINIFAVIAKKDQTGAVSDAEWKNNK